MPKAHFKMANRRSLYLCNTHVENIFINEFLPTAPGDYVKVYLFCQMYAQHNLDITYSEMSRLMGISQDEIKNAWEYWAKQGLVKITRGEDGDTSEIEFISLADKLFGSSVKPAVPDSVATDDSQKNQDTEQTVPAENGRYAQEDEDRFNQVMNAGISELYAQYSKYAGDDGRTVSQKELHIISDAIKVYNITPDIMSYAIKYCAEELGKPHASYMFSVARRWSERGCKTIDQARDLIDEFSKRNDYHQAIFKQMGFTRPAGPGDRELMDKWIETWDFTIGEVLEACRKTIGLRDPSLKYVDKVLENWLKEKGGIDTRLQNPAKAEASINSRTRSTSAEKPVPVKSVSKVVLEEYYDYIRNDGAKLQKARIGDLCDKLPEMKKLFSLESRLNNALLGGALSKEQRQQLREQKKELEKEKKKLLIENGFGEDYLDRKYKCSVCRDTGITDEGRICACRKSRVEEAFKWNQERNQK